jgi:hypothetical protein
MEQAADEAKRALLKKIEEESQKQLEESMDDLKTSECHVLAEVTKDEYITECDNLVPIEKAFGGSSEFVTASELMDSMVNGGKVKLV